MKRILMLFCVASVALVGVTNAAVQQGNTSLEFLGGWMQLNGAEGTGADTSAWFLAGYLEYFVTKEISVGGALMGAWIDTEGGDFSVYGIGGKAMYHFMTDNSWVPGVGAQVMWGQSENGDSANGLIWGPVVNLKYPLNENNDFVVQYQYLMFEEDLGDALKDAHAVFVAVAHWFKKGQ